MFKQKQKFEMSHDEAKTEFIKHIWRQLNYWDTVAANPNNMTHGESVSRYRLEGLMHSIFATLDGSVGQMPAFEIKALVSKADREFHKENGSKYFPEEDIGGHMCELMYPIGREAKLTK